MDTQQCAIEEDNVTLGRMQFGSSRTGSVLDTQIKAQSSQRLSVGFVHGNVCQQGQILDQTTRFTFGSVGWTQHPPLRRLKGSGSTHLASFFKLTVDPSYHPQRRQVRQSRQHLCHTGSIHPESSQDPIPGGNRIDQSM